MLFTVYSCSSDDIPLSQTCRKDLIITPTALAASMRIDSYYAPHLIPTAKLAFNMDCLEIRLSHHLSQLGKGRLRFVCSMVWSAGVFSYPLIYCNINQYFTDLLSVSNQASSEQSDMPHDSLMTEILIDVIESHKNGYIFLYYYFPFYSFFPKMQ